jgi:hypothetical protein
MREMIAAHYSLEQRGEGVAAENNTSRRELPVFPTVNCPAA